MQSQLRSYLKSGPQDTLYMLLSLTHLSSDLLGTRDKQKALFRC